MPVLRYLSVLEMVRGVKAFLKVEASLTRGAAPPSEPAGTGELEQAKQQIVGRDREIRKLQEKLAGKDGRPGGIDPENIIWIFGVARVGSTWLGSMMGETQGHTVWNEPRVGSLFGDFYYGRGTHRGGRHGILGGTDEKRSRIIRAFVLAAAEAKFGRMVDSGYLIVKEPNGSNGAPLLARALPESRLIFMVRDPRDVVSSGLGASTEGGWYAEARKRRGTSKRQSPEDIVEARAKRYVEYIGRSREAYEAHGGPKTLVRYEELRKNPVETMKHLYSDLKISVSEEEITWAVEKHSWENIPAKEKGPNKFYRKAKPGGWREDLTLEQVQTVERITAPLLKEFYPV